VNDFPVKETTGKIKDKYVSQISHLKYLPSEMQVFTLAEKRAQEKVGQLIKVFEMHMSAYYHALAWKKLAGGPA
jgi:hypothetical protein